MSTNDDDAPSPGPQSIPVNRVDADSAPAAADENEVVQLLAEVNFLRGRVEQLEDSLADNALDLSRFSVRATEAENELENAKSRIRREALKDAKRLRHDFFRDLLETVDNLERALETHGSDSDLSEGVRLVFKQFIKFLSGHGVVPMDSPDGQAFTPELHEAVSAMPVGPEDNGRVMGVLQKGYLVGDEVLRPAKVAVGKASN